MTAALSLAELLTWSDDTARNWFEFFAAEPRVLKLPCGIYKTENVQGLVRHIVAVEVRYSQRLAGERVVAYDEIDNLLESIVALHGDAIARYRALLADAAQDWNEVLEFSTLTAGTLRASRRKVLAHACLHAVRHWAQLSTLSRAAGFPVPFAGDLLLSPALE